MLPDRSKPSFRPCGDVPAGTNGSPLEGAARADLIGIDGHELASAEATGSADSVLSLVDRLSTDVLRRIWRARGPWPTFRLSAVTTTSPDALRAYLRR